MVVWQFAERNEWEVAIRRALETPITDISAGPDAFSLADPPTVRNILEGAGFVDVAFTDVHEPVYYGPDVTAALDWVRGFTCANEALNGMDSDAAARVLDRLRAVFASHLGDDGVRFDSRAWTVSARR
ncbi:hypothetical protein GCM10022254_01150 [Actinomadura meridiana]|uniref:Methyltransferase n=1 Tax=Actinomadura meridiana TaxID=559626 RepID=A0ABP8BRF2_9ACTN